jgi:hypothetical protein
MTSLPVYIKQRGLQYSRIGVTGVTKTHNLMQKWAEVNVWESAEARVFECLPSGLDRM